MCLEAPAPKLLLLICNPPRAGGKGIRGINGLTVTTTIISSGCLRQALRTRTGLFPDKHGPRGPGTAPTAPHPRKREEPWNRTRAQGAGTGTRIHTCAHTPTPARPHPRSPTRVSVRTRVFRTRTARPCPPRPQLTQLKQLTPRSRRGSDTATAPRSLINELAGKSPPPPPRPAPLPTGGDGGAPHRGDKRNPGAGAAGGRPGPGRGCPRRRLPRPPSCRPRGIRGGPGAASLPRAAAAARAHASGAATRGTALPPPLL